MIPSIAQCFALMEQYAMLPNIRAHSLMVGRVAARIGQGLARSGHTLSLELIVSSALLHDIAKTATLETELRHDELGREICLKHSLDELAEIVAEHVILKGGMPERCSEKEVVYYADKRVLHDQVVGLEARLDYILHRYGNGDEMLHTRIRQNFAQAHAIEERLFAELDFPPEELGTQLDRDLFRLEGFGA
ncbi:HD domain-containing protein [Thiovibrio frasassiensis]|jgi:putative nucleotidyltransferase with HDIG domain|uniref:HD domain-containing protein n=1 Tax=Thiovibrio frasassiensis TaxID=2984131 RepID=A0A9X4RKS1_9BACT|nr:HD domain-containing protein [Thiovibrio frasassiensis]MDG4474909.1 HD domain-containing protein [Thiovibrio frasassiensis]